MWLSRVWGVLTSIGEGVTAFTESLRLGRSGIQRDGAHGVAVSARIPDTGFANRLSTFSLPDELRMRARTAGQRASRSVQTSLLVTLEAWMDAGLTYAPESINLVVAGHNLEQDLTFRMAAKFLEHPEYVPARYALQFMDTDHIGTVSEVLNLRGEGATVGGASASGSVALLQAYRHVREGRCMACVVVGALADLSPVELRALQHIGAMGGKRFAEAPDQACRPFDADREGFIFGEGCACVILEAREEAEKRGAPIWGHVAGGAACLDGNRLSDPNVDGEIRVMRQALASAGLSPEAIGYVNTHGTSSLLGDEVEAQAIKTVFDGHLDRVWVNATKGLTGHALYAAGLVEAVAVLVQLREGFLHPNRNLESPIDPDLRFAASTSWSEVCDVALSNAFGFGGINSAMIFKRGADR